MDPISADHRILTISNQLYVSLKSGFRFPNLISADHSVLTMSN